MMYVLKVTFLLEYDLLNAATGLLFLENWDYSSVDASRSFGGVNDWCQLVERPETIEEIADGPHTGHNALFECHVSPR